MHSVDVGFTHVAFIVRCLASSIDFYTRYTAMTVIHQREPDLPRRGKWHGSATAPGLSPWCWCKVTIRPIRRWDRSAISASPAPPRPRSMRKWPSHGGKVFYAGSRSSWAIRWAISLSLPTRTVTPWSCRGAAGGTGSHPGGKTRRIIFHRLAGEDYTSKGYLGNTEHGDGQQEKR